jgi:ankyrin repeat protein
VKLLLEQGAELETKENYSRTPLLYAAGYGHEAVVKLLLEKGAELETKSNNCQTPLSYAARYRHEAVVKLRLEKGAEKPQGLEFTGQEFCDIIRTVSNLQFTAVNVGVLSLPHSQFGPF